MFLIGACPCLRCRFGRQAGFRHQRGSRFSRPFFASGPGSLSERALFASESNPRHRGTISAGRLRQAQDSTLSGALSLSKAEVSKGRAVLLSEGHCCDLSPFPGLLTFLLLFWVRRRISANETNCADWLCCLTVDGNPRTINIC